MRWSDLDPNFHIRHSVYYDWGAMVRIKFFNDHGITSEVMRKLNFGPIIFREECIFRREIRSSDSIFIDASVISARKDYSRFSIRHLITRDENVLCATLTVDIAWLDTNLRKLAVPPYEIIRVFENIPRAEDFKWSE
jgi:acyl-CoA thioester hydrolase